MRRFANLIGTMALLSTAMVLTAPSASAEPCGAGSYKEGRYQFVGYRNCAGSAIWLEASIDGDWGWCTKVKGNNSAALHRLENPDNFLYKWKVRTCKP